MTIQVALHHHTSYRFDRPVTVSPHEIRLRPAAHCRTPILSYSLKVKPAEHFVNWQQDAYGNFIARYVFPERTRELSIEVDLTADMTVINPFDFFVDEQSERYPFDYGDRQALELAPFRQADPAGPLLSAWLERFRRERLQPDMLTVDLLVALNQQVQRDVRYIVRMEPGVYDAEELLRLGQGSCRDSGWLLVQALRHLGFAARFVSGYLIQLEPDVKALDGPQGAQADFTDLHAWAEAFVPGAGWVGLDATSGLLAGEGHIPLACTALPASAAPVYGFTDMCEVHFDFSMRVQRIHEDARVTKPYTPVQWAAIDRLGQDVEKQLAAGDVRLTMGGEPTFVSVDDMDGAEWNFTAQGERKRELAGALLRRLQRRFAPGGLLHIGQGKWYPGEPLPRWALTCVWRSDGRPLWRNPALLADDTEEGRMQPSGALGFVRVLASKLGLHRDYIIPAYEDVWDLLRKEQDLPVNIDPLQLDLSSPAERMRLTRLLRGDMRDPAGFVLPLEPVSSSDGGAIRWISSRWPLRREHLYLIAGDSPLGLRLPLDSLPWVAPEDEDETPAPDPFAPRDVLAETHEERTAADVLPTPDTPALESGRSARKIVRTALCLEVRRGHLHVFLPPLKTAESFVALMAVIESSARESGVKIVLEGYLPPEDARLRKFAVTPDPGVIEVNIQPARDWVELTANTRALYEEARQTRLGTEKFMLDGRHTGTGGGNHVTVGGPSAADSPLLRRPDLLRSLITYWQNHPALSYLFSGLFIGPTSQAPRVDEARNDALYELEIAFQEMERLHRSGEESLTPWLVDRLLRNLLVDVTGNTHRAEFSIDKLYSPDSATGRLGLLEFRAFEMPPHWQMSMVQMLLLRALIARFWRRPYRTRLIHWGTSLHDRFMLPHFIAEDMHDVVLDLQRDGYAFGFEWFAPFLEFRFPRYGTVSYQGMRLELRQALEPWHVLGEEVQAGAMARYVDSSVERLQVKVEGMIHARYAVTCNGRPLPLTATGRHGEFVA
ncbi:MAG: transglutaminase family protein, partial [Burkholderiales bacterium]|nr:transglutaminase family protein [Burkholderiales bacterium]